MTEITLKQKTANGLFWGGFGNIVLQVIQAVYGVFLAQLLFPTDYAPIIVLGVFTGIALVIINSGFSVALINKKEATHDDYNAVFWFSFFTGLILYVLLFFCAPFIAEFNRMPELIAVSRVVFIGFFISGIGVVWSAIITKKLMIRQQMCIDVVSLVVSVGVGLYLAFNGFTYWALAIQPLAATALGVGLRIAIVPWRPTFQIHFEPLKGMLGFSLKIFFTNIFQTISGNIFSVLLGRFYPKDAVGFYGQGQKWAVMGQTSIYGMISSVTQPVLVHVGDDKKRQVHVFRKLIRFGACMSFPLLLGLAFVAQEFIVVICGEKWLASVPYLQLFCIWGAFVFLNTFYINLLYSQGKSNNYMNGTIVIGVLQLLIVAGLYPFGIFPMIIGYLAMNFVGLGIWQFYAHQLIGLRLRDVLRDILPYLGITLSCFGVAWLVTLPIHNIYFLLSAKILITAIFYICILKISKAVIFQESMDFLLKRKNS